MIASPLRVAGLAILLLVLGFIVGYGYHTLQSQTIDLPAGNRAVPTPTLTAPVAKGLVISPDDRWLAFAGIYDQTQQACRFLLNLQTSAYKANASPRGWQDYPTQWSADGSSLLVSRERIPRPVEDATAGIYVNRLNTAGGKAPSVTSDDKMELLTKHLTPPEEKAIAGFWTGDDQLIIKTRREPKALYEIHNGNAQLIDRAYNSYDQNRMVQENGSTVYYVTRDMPGQPQNSALYRIEHGKLQQLSEPLGDPVWVYIAENARWMLVCRQAANGDDWVWTLYEVTPHSARKLKSNTLPGDIIAVYWSPDFKHVLGASGKSLWLIDIPDLQARQLGDRHDWNTDDAAWLHHSPAVVVASAGHFWRIEVPGGTTHEVWQFPKQYWK